jgi:hypothetical protein
MARVDYIRRDNGKLVGYAVMIKRPDPPQDPRISQMGWPDPVGVWVYHEIGKV